MSFLDHIAVCNAHDMTRFRRFLVDGRPVGWVRHDVAALLAGYGEVFRVEAASVTLHPGLSTPDQRSAAVEAVAGDLHRSAGTPRLRGERYAVAERWGAAPLMTIDRGVVSLLGLRSYGVHVNGLVGGHSLWIGKRAANKSVAPGKLDNMIAGGQPAGLSLMDNLIKEAAEEADIPETLARTARPVGAVSYCLEDEWGLKPDLMFCYDLEVPPDVIPRNTDGEIEDFRLMEIARVAELVRETDQFKYNVNLVLIDLLIRRGWLSPDSEPDYICITKRLRS